MQPITVAIADENTERRARFERALHREQGISMLTSDVSKTEGAVARVRQLSPRVLLADLKQCTDADGAMLRSLRHACPDTLVVMLADESAQQEDLIIQALAGGARGYISLETEPILVSKAVQVIDRGEAWIPRKMLGKIMDQVLNALRLPPELADRTL